MIAYFSKKLRSAEVKYATTDKEALAVVLACRQFHHYLWGTECIIRTDHQPIVSVFKQGTKSPRMNRWILEMRDYRYKMYKAGNDNVVAVQLSRMVQNIREMVNMCLGKTREELVNLQRQDRRWREMVNYLQGGRTPRSKYPRATLDQFALEDEILYLCKKKTDGTILYLLVVPQ